MRPKRNVFLLNLIKNGTKLTTFWVCSTALICIEQQCADPQDSKVHTHPLKVRIFFLQFYAANRVYARAASIHHIFHTETSLSKKYAIKFNVLSSD